jgi:arabinan endo-1,5-alpha-L-arabinosidase
MLSKKWGVGLCLLLVCLLAVCSCGGSIGDRLSYAQETKDPLAIYTLSGDTAPVLDPSIIRSDSAYYAFSTDVGGSSSSGHLPMRCSTDEVNWTLCGSVFPGSLPAWIRKAAPSAVGLWAPDISYFNGDYHVYYCASSLHSQQSVIGLATNTTLNPADPNYRWTDRGPILASHPGDDFNALDPNIFVDQDGSIWLTYGSYWTGIKQRQIDPSTGLLLPGGAAEYALAQRPGVPSDPIEGASLVHHGNYYYLFVSVDFCCEQNPSTNSYKQAVGRSSSPHGPFVDQAGTPMLSGGGTVLLKGNAKWSAPGGGSVYVSKDGSESLICFHAHNRERDLTPFQWVARLEWVNDWPVIGD